MSLEAVVGLRKGTLDLDVELEVASNGVVVLLGPNAAGKTTLLRALAGLVPLERGRVVLDGVVLDDPAAGVRVPTERRPIGVVFQDYLLFPHLSVLENVAFGPRSSGAGRTVAREHALALLDRVGLVDCAAAKPRALSGGQAQRVALARALATDPRLLLLDEPLAAMDAGARAELRRGLSRHLAAFPGICLVITHDPIEAMTLGDHLVVAGSRTRGAVRDPGRALLAPALALRGRAARPEPVPRPSRAALDRARERPAPDRRRPRAARG